MSILDELRQAIDSHAPYERVDQPDWDTVKSVLGAIDAFEAEHPGLMDHTMHCYACGKPMWDSRCEYAEELGGLDVWCSPACAKETGV